MRKGLFSLQTTVALTLLENIGSEFGQECPTGRGASRSKPAVFLPRDMCRDSVYQIYKTRHTDMIAYLLTNGPVDLDDASSECFAPLHMNTFARIWRTRMPTLRIRRSGSDFCDVCTHLTQLLETTEDTLPHEKLSRTLQKHKADARSEFENYRSMQDAAKMRCNDGSLHFIFDFAEKVLLPHMLRKPGQLHFVTGLKIDRFGVCYSNLDRTDINCLTEGQWPGGKTADEVCSMLHTSIASAKNDTVLPKHRLMLHADNCGGQNKNRFVLWYFLWRIIVGLEDDIQLFFMIAGHTKNRCDGSFGFVKRRFRRQNVYSPHEMVTVINESATTNSAILPERVKWRQWKRFLLMYCTVPSGFRLSKEHFFHFSSHRISSVRVRHLSGGFQYRDYSLLKPGVTPDALRSASRSFLNTEAYSSPIRKLHTVSSAHEGNRREYLIKNIFERYFPGNEELVNACLGSVE